MRTRAKEAADRERQEAIKSAQKYLEEIVVLKKSYSSKSS